ncbi:TetR/AcrR family transcriptional regulator [Mycolicibacterium thermoresistibile]
MTKRSPAARSRRRGRPSGTGDTDTRTALIDAALKLMNDEPWQRVSAKAVADAAGCDPALITYYFGSRQGLVSAVGEQAARTLRGRMSVEYTEHPDAATALRRAVTDPLEVVAHHPLLAQLYVGELLFHGQQRTDQVLHDMAVPYFEQVLAVAERDGVLRRVSPMVLLYTITALSLFTSFLGPLAQRGVPVPQSAADALRLTTALADLMLSGVVATDAGAGKTRRRGRRSAPQRDRPDAELCDELVLAAIEMLRRNGPEEVTPAALAAATGHPETAVYQCFPGPYELMSAVAVAASRMVPTTPNQRRRGRPANANPPAERELIRAAVEQVADGGVVSVRAVAARAGCDPALVTYYFGGRRGLIRAVAEQTLVDVVAASTADPSAPLPTRLRSALQGPAVLIAEQPALAELIMDEFLIRGDRQSDDALGAVIEPYLHRIRTLVDEGLTTGELKPAQPEDLLYAVGVLPLFICAATPLLHRALGADVPAVAPAQFVEEVLDVVCVGLLAAPAAPARRSR